jgi:CRP-like cAMP-binding protein
MAMSAEDYCRKIKSDLRFFTYLDEPEKAIVGQYLECCELTSGTVLWHEGEASGSTAFVVEGKVEVKKETEFEGKHVIVGIYGDGSVVGELCLFSGDKRAVTATALTDAWLLQISDAGFETLLAEHPATGAKLLKGMLFATSRRLRKSYERLAAIF